jgi:UDP-sugar transporter A1/2/3
MVFAILNLSVWSREEVLTRGYHADYSLYTIGIIFLNSGGGLLVALVVQRTSAIMKNFAMCMAIIINGLIAVYLGASWSLFFVLGIVQVLISMMAYNAAKSDPSKAKEAKSAPKKLDSRTSDAEEAMELLPPNSATPTKRGLSDESV